MSNKRGPDFGEVAPKNTTRGQIRATGPGDPFATGASAVALALTSDNYDLANGQIKAVTPLNAFRPGQQVLFWLTIYNRLITFGEGQQGFISQVKLKPWWLRPNLEFRAPGYTSWHPVDEQTFSGGTEENNRRGWVPSQKIISVNEWSGSTTPPPSLKGHVDSYYVDDVWVFDLQDPTDADYENTPIGDQQGLWRAVGFFYVSHGYALGFTCDATIEMTEGEQPEGNQTINFDLNWVNGTLG